MILSRPWHHAHSQLISTLPADRPSLDFALDLAEGSSGQVRDLPVLSQGGEQGTLVVSVRPARCRRSVPLVSSQLSVSASVCSIGRVVSPARRALLLGVEA